LHTEAGTYFPRTVDVSVGCDVADQSGAALTFLRPLACNLLSVCCGPQRPIHENDDVGDCAKGG